MSQSAPCIRFDDTREERIGLPEAVLCEGKPYRALLKLIARFAEPGEKPILFTRLAQTVFDSLPEQYRVAYNYCPISRTAWARKLAPRQGRVAVVSAGTADHSVTLEVSRTLEYLGYSPEVYQDCGVAGLWRLQGVIADINRADVIVAVAGLDAALATVLGGLSPLPVIAVPTSVGYGVAQGGHAALNSMLASCAQGIAVMNIDNGFGAACAAARICHAMYRH